MSANQCSSCGSGTSPNHLTCQSCGAVHVDLDPKQELDAIKEVAATARKIGAESENILEALMAQTGAAEGQSKHERIAQLWTYAFIPMTFEAQFQALNQCVGAIKTSGRSDHAGKIMANQALVRRGELLVASMEAHGQSDPSLRPRFVAAKTLFEQTRDRSASLEKAGKRKAYIAIAVSVGMVVIMGTFVFSIMPDMSPVTPTPPTVESTTIPSELRGTWVHQQHRQTGCSETQQKVLVTSNTIDWAESCSNSRRETISGVKVTENDGTSSLVEGSYNGGDCKGTTLERMGDELILSFRCQPGESKAMYGSFRNRTLTFTRSTPAPAVAADTIPSARKFPVPAKLRGNWRSSASRELVHSITLTKQGLRVASAKSQTGPLKCEEVIPWVHFEPDPTASSPAWRGAFVYSDPEADGWLYAKLKGVSMQIDGDQLSVSYEARELASPKSEYACLKGALTRYQRGEPLRPQ
jgi:hypothetical protein